MLDYTKLSVSEPTIIQMPASTTSDNIASLSLSSDSRIFLTTLESARDFLARRLVEECHAITEQDLNYTILSSILQVIFLKTGQESGFAEPRNTPPFLPIPTVFTDVWHGHHRMPGLNPNILFEKGPESFHTIPSFLTMRSDRLSVYGFREISGARFHASA